MKKLLSSILIISLFCTTIAQGDYEAFRFSQIEYQGTARYMGAGGAFSATGGEFSALNVNPAAIGLYKRHEATFTPFSLAFTNNSSSYYGNTSSTMKAKYTVPQCGLVISNHIENSNWNYWHFGFGYNRIMDYNNTFRANGIVSNSIVNTILPHANGTPYSALTGDASLAWSTWLIDTIPGTNNLYYSPFENAKLGHDAVVKTSGAMDEISFSFGGNYSDKLFVGATIGVPVLDYKEVISYAETASDEVTLSHGIRSFQTNSTQQNSGGGVNLKLGLIYQPVNFLRVGASFQTPTYFWRIRDSYNRNMISYYTNGNNSDTWSYDNGYRFSLTTPLKFNVSAAFLIKKRAFISAEYDFIDYSMSKLYADDYAFDTENQAIDNKFGICHTVKLGAEINVTSKFLLRAGYNYKTSPYKNFASSFNGSAHYGSVGFGIRTKYVFFDMAYVMKYGKDSFWLYPDNNSQNMGEYEDLIHNPGSDAYFSAISTKGISHRIVATIGCKF